MTASIANGFGHVLFQPNAKHVPRRPVRVPSDVQLGGAARVDLGRAHHQRGRLRRDRPLRVLRRDRPQHGRLHGTRAPATPTLDEDDQFCLDGSNYPGAQPIIGCLLDDGDFDGPSYQLDLAGHVQEPERRPAVARDAVHVHAAHARTASRSRTCRSRPTCRASSAASRATISPSATRDTGAHCVNPPIGREVLSHLHAHAGRTAAAGSSRAAPTSRAPSTPSAAAPRRSTATKVLFVHYADVGFKPIRLAEDFHRDLHGNPCART